MEPSSRLGQLTLGTSLSGKKGGELAFHISKSDGVPQVMPPEQPGSTLRGEQPNPVPGASTQAAPGMVSLRDIEQGGNSQGGGVGGHNPRPLQDATWVQSRTTEHVPTGQCYVDGYNDVRQFALPLLAPEFPPTSGE